jgi:hypothetical protein
MDGIKQLQWEAFGCTMQARNPKRGIRACLSEGSQNDTVYSFGLGFARNESEGQGRDKHLSAFEPWASCAGGDVVKNHSACVLFLAAACTLSYGQNSQDNDNGQGDQQGRPAVPKLRQGEIRPHARIRGFVGRNVNQAATTYMTPARMTAAYGINGVGSGQGATVVIVDAYDAPNVATDLASFMSTWGISCPTPGWGTFTEVNQNGSAAPLPGYDAGWEAETSMDTQWVRAIAPWPISCWWRRTRTLTRT